MNSKIAGCIFTVFFLIACHEYTPKPIGYNRIEFSESDGFKKCSFENFFFEYSDLAVLNINREQSEGEGKDWFDIVYPEYGARVYCTYLPIKNGNFARLSDDSYRMAYSHVLMASEIKQIRYADYDNRIYGIFYEIEGDVATPMQFFVTDSIHNFLRGSFYYDSKVRSDSVAPITEFVITDIKNMVATLRWKSSQKIK